MRTFIDLPRLNRDTICELLEWARTHQGKRVPHVLAGRSVGLLFLNPSLRTLASMQVAVEQLGGHSVVVQPGTGSWKLELRDGAVMDEDAVEHVREAIPVFREYFDLLGVRCFAEGKDLSEDLADKTINRISDLFGGPFMNLESAAAHPCQALADWKTLDDFKIPSNGHFVLSWAYHPKPLPFAVPRSALLMALQRGMDVTVLRPDGYNLPRRLVDEANALSGTWRETSDRREALEGAHVLYCKSWARPAAYGSPEDRAHLRDWTVDEPWFAHARPDAKFMHCLPVRRNVKVTDAVLDGPRSVVIPQAGNRLHVQKAVLAHLSQEIA